MLCHLFGSFVAVLINIKHETNSHYSCHDLEIIYMLSFNASVLKLKGEIRNQLTCPKN